MAEENEQSGEKEFEASQAKRDQARKEGDVAQSKEANALALFLGVFCAALLLQASIGAQVFQDFSALLYHGDAFANDVFQGDGGQMQNLLTGSILKMSPLLIILAVIVLIALVLQQSISFSFKKIKPDVKKISPVANLGKKYGPRGLLDFLKDTAKMLFAGLIATVFLLQFTRNYYSSSALQEGRFADFTFSQILYLITCFCVFQFVLAAIDLPLQRQLHERKLRMTREEMKKELKQNEGDPHLKQQRREKGAKISRGQMLQNVKEASVVMVNPEHYAVALKWDPEGHSAPVCVAKGVDHLAARIREVATAHGVQIYRDPPATRSIYRMVDIDEEILPEHFAAVAAAIQFAERVAKQTGGGGGA